MIVYSKEYLGFSLFFRLVGSPVLRALPFPCLSTFITLWLNRYAQENVGEYIVHPYPYQIFAFMLGFIVTFRTNYAYQRYMEGRGSIQVMSAKWMDAVVQALSFERYNDKGTEHESVVQFRRRCLHFASLLHATSLQYLRTDTDLNNLKKYNPDDCSKAINLHKNGNGYYLNTWYALGGSYYSNERRDAYCREVALEVIEGVTEEEVTALLESGSEQVHVVYTWLTQVLVDYYRSGGMQVAPPIFSRTFQVLSDGMLGFMQARKIADTPFPFPYAQMVFLLLVIFSTTLPIVMVSKLESVWLAPLFTFIATFAYFSVNEVARELEDPWRYHPNELPAGLLQHQFNCRLMQVALAARREVPDPLEAEITPLASPKSSRGDSSFEQAPPNSSCLQRRVINTDSTIHAGGINIQGLPSLEPTRIEEIDVVGSIKSTQPRKESLDPVTQNGNLSVENKNDHAGVKERFAPGPVHIATDMGMGVNQVAEQLISTEVISMRSFQIT